MIEIVVLGDPKPQPRHRHFSRGKFVQTYDPAKEKKQSFLSIVLNQAPKKPFDEPLHIDLEFHFQRPKGHFGTGRNEGVLKKSAPMFHTKTPDVDNICKFVFDAMNKVFWRDDSVICSTSIKKFYCIDDAPRTVIRIKQLNPIE